jgi:hypothetical protein
MMRFHTLDGDRSMVSTEQLCLFCEGVGSLSIDRYPMGTYSTECFVCEGSGKIRVQTDSNDT